jgi:hypothetical protein
MSETIREWARKIGERTRREQGLPPTITDPAVIDSIAAALETAPQQKPGETTRRKAA